MPDRHTLYSAQVLTQQLYPRFVASIRELAGGALIMLPSSVKDFSDPEIAGADRNDAAIAGGERAGEGEILQAGLGRARFGIASRHLQYEMFYAGATFVTRGHSFRTYDWSSATGLVDEMLAGYDTGGEIGHDYENQS